MFGFLKRFHRRAKPADALVAGCREMPLLQRLSPDERQRLLALADDFLDAKTLEGAADLIITERMRALVALQASLPLLHLNANLYDGWHSIILYPDEFRAPYEFIDSAGVVHQGSRDLSGEAWKQGPVVLAWSHAEEDALDRAPAGNVVIHEMAHKLDLLNGHANGMPPLHWGMSIEHWSRVMQSAYDDLQQHLQWNAEPPIDPYAAQSPGEFFAVTTELFFVWPENLRAAYPDVFDQLARYYQPEN